MGGESGKELYAMSRPVKETTHKTRLNQKQLHLLKMTYKFRFVTASLLARYKGLSISALNYSLAILADSGYLGRKYGKNYRIFGKGAVYYLTPKSLALLKDLDHTDHNVLHAQYKNKTVGQSFIDHNLDVFAAYLSLRGSYPDTFHIFTKSELAPFEYFPEPRPDLYLNRIKPVAGRTREYMVEILPDTQFFVLKKRFQALIEHFDSGEWENAAETDYPTLLLVCPDAKTERRVQELAVKTFDSTGIDDLVVLTTTLNTLKTSANPIIWSRVNESEKLIPL